MNNPNSHLYYGILKSDNLIYNLTNNENTIGRNPEVNIVLNHPSISKEQAVIKFDHNKIPYIIDLNSSNGTWVNNNRLTSNSPIIINHNDRLRFGKDNIEYSVEPYDNNMIEKTIVIPSSIHDDKVSLVNLETYQGATKNHFERKPNNSYMKTISFRDMNSLSLDSPKFYSTPPMREEIYDSDQEENTLQMSSSLQQSQGNNNIKPSLYQDLFKTKNELEGKIKDKTNELDNIKNLYEQLNENYNKLNAKHNALMVYASDLQKKNDSVSFTLKEKNEALSLMTDSDLGKMLSEKDVIIKALSNDNEILKKELEKIGNTYNSSDNGILIGEKILNDYIMENGRLKKILEKYQSNENECTRKWNELLQTNEALNNKVNELKRDWESDTEKYQSLINAADKRIMSILEQVPKTYDKFNIRKEEAAKYLVEQVKIYLEEKENIIKENTELKRKINDLTNENNHLKQDLEKYYRLINLNQGQQSHIERIEELEDLIRELKQNFKEEKCVNYEEIIRRQLKEISVKDKLIEDMKKDVERIITDH